MGIPKFLSDQELSDLKTVLEKFQNRDTLMLHMLATYGMRAGELLSIKKCDIDLDRKTVAIKGTKGSNDREFPLDAKTFARLCQQASASGSEKVFPISYKRLQHVWYHYRTCKKKLHALRHTVGVRTYQKKRDILLTQQVLGHKSIKTTMVYLTYSYTSEQFKNLLLD